LVEAVAILVDVDDPRADVLRRRAGELQQPPVAVRRPVSPVTGMTGTADPASRAS
jgi:hypothetical protein